MKSLIAATGADYPSEAHEFTPVFSGVRITRYLVLCVYFVDRCLSFCPFPFWSLCCLSFVDLRILITPFSYCILKLFVAYFAKYETKGKKRYPENDKYVGVPYR